MPFPATFRNISAYYLYGSIDPPADRTSDALIRDPDLVSHASVDRAAYMASIGRFALPANFEIVQKFFGLMWHIPPKYDAAGNIAFYTKQEIRSYLGYDEDDFIGLIVRQWQYEDGHNDYAERVWIWNSTAFMLSEDIKFFVGDSGNRWIENLSVRELVQGPPENFDFNSNDLAAIIGNFLGVHDFFDPSRIGRRVDFTFDGSVPVTASYNLFDYQAQQQIMGTWTVHTLPPASLLSLIVNEIEAIRLDGVANYLDDSDRPILYGTLSDDIMEASRAAALPLFESFYQNGVVLIGGTGNDQLAGGVHNDHLLGGAGEDLLVGDDGEDELDGGDANDSLSGGDDDDDIFGGDGADIISGGDGDDDINGDDGDDRIAGDLGSDVIQGGGGDDIIVGEEGFDTLRGGSGRDIISGGEGIDELSGEDGNDILSGGADNDVIRGGGGDDIIEAVLEDGAADDLYGGAGADIFNTNHQDEIFDIDAGDRVLLLGVRLTGGSRDVSAEEAESSSGTYYNGSVEYEYNHATRTLVVTGNFEQIIIRDFTNGEGGISLRTRSDDDSGGGVDGDGDGSPDSDQDDGGGGMRPPTMGDPLILDLDGDGVEMTNIETTTVHFDTDNDGIVEQVGWVGADDGLLARDLNGDGLVNNLSELFGTISVDGFTILAGHDGNGDDLINASDEIWSTLRIWRDANTDGDTDFGELRTLAEVGIVGISLSAEPVDQGDDGNIIAFRGSFEWADGSIGEAAAAFIRIAAAPDANIEGLDFEPVYLLPDLGSLGDAPSLRAAMDADPALYEQVHALVENARNWSADEFRDAFEQMLLDWAGIADAPEVGPHGDARHIAFVEAVTGEIQQVRQGDGSFVHVSFYPGMAAYAEERYETLVNEYLLRFGGQLAISEIALGIDENATITGPFAALFNATSFYDVERNTLFANPFEMALSLGRHASTADDAFSFLARTMPFLQALQFDAEWGRAGRPWSVVETGLGNGLRIGGVTDSALIEFAIERAHGTERSFLAGGDGDDLLAADESRGSTFAGGLGDDEFIGGEHADTYVYAAGDGGDSIEEFDDSGPDPAVFPLPVDRLLMVGLTAADVTIAAEGDDIVLTIAGGGSIRLIGQLAGAGIEEVLFSDGGRYTASDLASLTFDVPITAGDDDITGTRFNDDIDGLAGNDVIRGGAGSDRLAGGLGDDLVYGGQGDDSYVYRAGDGDDVLMVLEGQVTDFEVVRLIGIDPDDVLVRRRDDGSIELEIGGSQPGSLVIVPQPDDLGIDRIEFDGEVAWTRAMIQARLVSSQATTGDDHILGNHTDRFSGDDLAGGRGDDILEGQGGRDFYRYRLGDGHDTIIDFESGWGPNALRFEDLLPEDLRFERGGEGLADLVIHVERPEGGSITIPNAFIGSVTSAVAAIWFADGSTIGIMDLAATLLAELSTEGDDLLIGLEKDDEIFGLGGNDQIEDSGGMNLIDGGAGDDVIVDVGFIDGSHLGTVRGGLGDDDITTFGIVEYARGDGDDLLRTATSLHLTDIDPADVTFAFGASDDDLVISIGGSQPGSITIHGQWLDEFQGVSPLLQEVVFADGSRMSDQAIADALLDTRATTGDDVIHGMGKRGDTLRGGLGDDQLLGGVGNDTYVHAAGDGNDLVDDQDLGSDRLVLHGIAPADVTVTQSGSDALLSFTGGGSIRIADQFRNLTGSQQRAIESIEFDGGFRWSAADLYHAAHDVGADDEVNGSAGNDTLTGTGASETFHGGAGDDTINDAGGSDIFLFGAGDGHDVVNNGNSGAGISYDTLRIDRPPSDVELTRLGTIGLEVRIVSTGDTVTFGGGDLAFIEFSDGTRWDAAQIAEETVIRGTAGNDLLEGRVGYFDETFHAAGGSDDEIWGYGGNDTYIYRPGDGFLTISASHAVEAPYGAPDTDTLWLRGFDPADVILSVEPHFTNFGDDPNRAFDGEADLVVRFRNQAGAVRIFENLDEVGAPDGVYGLERIKFDDGTVWTLDDILEQAGTYGSALPDILFSSHHGSGIINGGAGNDRIFEAGDGHVIRWSVGDGDDRIIDSSQSASLVLTDLLSTEAVLTRDGEILLVTVGGETVRIENQFAPGGTNTMLVGGEWVVQPWHPGLGTIVFADGTITREELFQQLPAPGTPDGDSLLGSDFGEALAGGGGDDLIEAGAGDDMLDGDEGEDDLRGEAGDDVLTGGAGADMLDGGSGGDDYVWTIGDGDDAIADRAGRFDGADTLRLVGVDPADLVFTRLPTADEGYPYDALEIRILSSGETITIPNQYFVEHLAASYIEQAQEPPPEGEPQPARPLTWFVQGIERIALDDGTEIDVVALGSESYHANPDSIHVSPDGIVVIDPENLLANDLVPFGGGAAAIVAAGDAENGTVTLNADGTLTFAAAPGFTGIAGFSYTVSHGSRLSTATVRIDVSVPPPIVGTEFDDELTGTPGDDVFIAGDGYDYVYGEGGVDTAQFTGWPADFVIYVDYDGSVVVGDLVGNEGWDTHYDVELLYFAGDDTLIAVADLPPYGTEADDVITGTSRTDYLFGEGGNDTLTGGAGDDRLAGGDGDDAISGDEGADSLEGGAGADLMAGGDGDDYYEVDEAGDGVIEAADGGHDLVYAQIDYTLPDNVEDLEMDGTAQLGIGNDLDNTIYGHWELGSHLQGLGGDDILEGGSGNDLVEGGTGANVMFGGTGDDQFSGSGEGNQIDGGEGEDRLNLAGSRGDYSIARDGDTIVVQGLGGEGSFVLTSVESVYFAGEGLSFDFDDLLAGSGTPGDDLLEGDGLDNMLHGYAGNDVLRGMGGHDLLDGGTGADTMEGGPGNDVYVVGEAGDIVTEAALAGTDEVRTTLASYVLTANVERLTGLLATGQTLTGNASANVLTGGAGADMLNGGLGSDTAAYAWSQTGVSVDLQTGATGGAAAGDTFASIENLTGGLGADMLSGTSAANILDGGADADTMTGRGGNDIYYVDNAGDGVVELAGQGNDEVRTTLSALALAGNVEILRYAGTGDFEGQGNGLNNSVYGGAGNDELVGGAGYDTLIGGAGADQLFGGSEGDVLDGGTGADHMEGGDGSDNYIVDNAGDVVVEQSGEGVDLVYASAAEYTLAAEVENLTGQIGTGQHLVGNGLANLIWAGGGADALEGGDGDDELRGNGGDDSIAGGDGADLVVGGSGIDTLTGGAGADTFRFGGWDSTTGYADWITDFDSGVDKIDLGAVDAGFWTSGDQAFTFIGSEVFSATAGELRYHFNGTHTHLRGDWDGDGAADLVIILSGEVVPLSSDFIL